MQQRSSTMKRECEDGIQVAVRVRPLTQLEALVGIQTIISCQGTSCILIDPSAYSAAVAVERNGGQAPHINTYTKHFTYDHCFWSVSQEDAEYSDQDTVYNVLGDQVLQHAWEGYNSTILAYGQTGAGKSYSMMGTGAALDYRVDPADHGLIPRICEGLFAGIENSPQICPDTGAQLTYDLKVSYIEIYNETVRDLFSSNRRGRSAGSILSGGLRVREDPITGAYVEGLSVVSVTNYHEISQLLTFGGQARTVAATNSNEQSSRSHSIFTMIFTQGQYEGTRVYEKVSRVNLVDLAGSERVGTTGATGLRLKEAGSINKSLATLSDVIKSLTEAQQKGRTSPFIPYRDSKLTRLLKESLGGNARTVVLACVSPCDIHYEETLSTLKYAQRAKRVKTYALVNEASENEGGLVQQLQDEVADLRRKLEAAYDPGIVTELNTLKHLVEEKEAKIQELQSASTNAHTNSPLRASTVLNDLSSYVNTSTQKAAFASGAIHIGDLNESNGDNGENGTQTLPRLVNLNQDPLFSECLVYVIKEGVSVVGSGEHAAVQLGAEDILPHHAIITYTGGMVTLLPAKGAHVYINGLHLCGTDEQNHTPVLLTHNSRVIFGRYHVLRFEFADHHAESETTLLNTSSNMIDWEFAQNELLRKNSDLTPKGGGLALYELERKVQELEAEKKLYKDRLLEQCQNGSGASSPFKATEGFSSPTSVSSGASGRREYVYTQPGVSPHTSETSELRQLVQKKSAALEALEGRMAIMQNELEEFRAAASTVSRSSEGGTLHSSFANGRPRSPTRSPRTDTSIQPREYAHTHPHTSSNHNTHTLEKDTELWNNGPLNENREHTSFAHISTQKGKPRPWRPPGGGGGSPDPILDVNRASSKVSPTLGLSSAVRTNNTYGGAGYMKSTTTYSSGRGDSGMVNQVDSMYENSRMNRNVDPTESSQTIVSNNIFEYQSLYSKSREQRQNAVPYRPSNGVYTLHQNIHTDGNTNSLVSPSYDSKIYKEDTTLSQEASKNIASSTLGSSSNMGISSNSHQNSVPYTYNNPSNGVHTLRQNTDTLEHTSIVSQPYVSKYLISSTIGTSSTMGMGTLGSVGRARIESAAVHEEALSIRARLKAAQEKLLEATLAGNAI